MLPAGNLFQNEQPNFVAGIEKMTGLRIVRGSNDVALELIAQNVSISPLNACGHRLTDPGERLVTIKSSQLNNFAVQFKARIGELGLATTKAAGVFVNDLRT